LRKRLNQRIECVDSEYARSYVTWAPAEALQGVAHFRASFASMVQAWMAQSFEAHKMRHSLGHARFLVMRSSVAPQATGPHYLDASVHAGACTTVHHDKPVALHRHLVLACDPPSGHLNLLTHTPWLSSLEPPALLMNGLKRILSLSCYIFPRHLCRKGYDLD
jgi:hypothetical protein